MTPWPLATMVAAPVAGYLSDRYSVGVLGAVGLTLFACGLMALALGASALRLAPDVVTTLVGIAGFVGLMYGVHLGWTVFYDRESDGPPV